MKINLSKDIPYYSQRNNKFYPASTCNTTSMIVALLASGIQFEVPEETQAEDHLTQILESDEAWEKLQKDFPWAIKGGYSPRNVHGMLSWAVNDKLIGKKVTSFRTDADIEQIIFSVVKGCAVVVGGQFTQYGHIVTVVGVETKQDISKINKPSDVNLDDVKSIIIDDPYGNYFTDYKDHKGNDIPFSLKQFNQLTREYNDPANKYAHFFGGMA